MKKVIYALISLLLLTGLVIAGSYTTYSQNNTTYKTQNILTMYPNANPKNLEPQTMPVLIKESDD